MESKKEGNKRELIRLIQEKYKEIVVRVKRVRRREFEVKVGLHQGPILSPLTFHSYAGGKNEIIILIN